MAEISNRTFGRGQVVELDGNTYRGCTFAGARMRFSGGALPSFSDCKIQNVTWAFGGAAGNAFMFLSALHNHFGPAGRRDALELIKNIMNGQHRSE